jgi:uncharacterized membrane protein YhaH (DUF805 family)
MFISIVVVVLTVVEGIAIYADGDLSYISQFYDDTRPSSLLQSALLTLASFSLLLISVGIRRMHDCGKSGGYFFIPIYGWFVLTSMQGMSGSNQYGPDPLQPTTQLICETCGKELQAGWKICPYCQTSTATQM